MNIFLLGDVPNDLVSFTFFIGTMAMMAASVFFFLSLDAGGGKWRTSMLVSDRVQLNDAIYFDEDLNIIDEFSPISNLCLLYTSPSPRDRG